MRRRMLVILLASLTSCQPVTKEMSASDFCAFVVDAQVASRTSIELQRRGAGYYEFLLDNPRGRFLVRVRESEVELSQELAAKSPPVQVAFENLRLVDRNGIRGPCSSWFP